MRQANYITPVIADIAVAAIKIKPKHKHFAQMRTNIEIRAKSFHAKQSPVGDGLCNDFVVVCRSDTSQTHFERETIKVEWTSVNTSVVEVNTFQFPINESSCFNSLNPKLNGQ